MKPDFSFGNFVWWLGKVEDIKDKEMLGRVKVKVYGYYDDIETENLPWAAVMGPIQSSSLGGVGYSPTGLQVGSTVVGFFLDGEQAQTPLVIGSLYGIPGGHDVHALARGQNKSKKTAWGGGSFMHPGTSYNAKYPENHVISGKSGVIVEMDNTSGKERYAWEHPSGTWAEADYSGNHVHHTSNDHYVGVEGSNTHMTAGDSNIWVGGNAKIFIDGSVDLVVGGDYKVKVGGNYILEIEGMRIVTTKKTVLEGSEDDHRVIAPRIFLN